MIGHGDVLVTQRTRSVRHLDDGLPPSDQSECVDSHPAALSEGIAGHSKRWRLRFQLREVCGNLAGQRLQDHGLRGFTDSFQGAKPLAGGHAFQFAGFERGDRLGGATERSDAIRRRLDRSNRNAIRFSASTGSMGFAGLPVRWLSRWLSRQLRRRAAARRARDWWLPAAAP